MNNQAKSKVEELKKLNLPEKAKATLVLIEKLLESEKSESNAKGEAALNKFYNQVKEVAAKKREEKTKKEVNEKTIQVKASDVAAPEEKKQIVKVANQFDDAIDKALKNDPELANFGKSDKRRDAGRKALPAGRRVAQKGWANQFGKSDGGRVYYENRENRKDRKSPAYKQGYPFLAKGGKIHPMDDEDGTFYVNFYKTKGGNIVSVDEREYKSKASAMTYAMMKRDFMTVDESIFVMNDDGDVLYTSIGTRKMAMGGKFPYQNAQVGDSARVILENKMGTIMVTYGRRFHLKFPDGTEKTYSAEELEFYPDNNMMAKGGDIQSGMTKDFSGNYYSTNDFVGSNGLKDLANKVFGMGWEAEDDVNQIAELANHAGLKYVIIYAQNRSEWNNYRQIDTAHPTNDSNYDIFVIANQDWKKYVNDSEGDSDYDDGEYAKGGMMAKGGEVEVGIVTDLYENVNGKKIRTQNQRSIKEAIESANENSKYYKGYAEVYIGAIYVGSSRNGVFKYSSKYKGNKYDQGGMMPNGGYMAEGENYEYVNTFKRFDSNVPVPQDDFEKLVDAYHKQLSGDKLAVSKYKVLKLQMGNYLGHKTVEEMEAYIEKTHNAHKMAKGGMMADGGSTNNFYVMQDTKGFIEQGFWGVIDANKNELIDIFEFKKEANGFAKQLNEKGKANAEDFNGQIQNYAKGGMMADGGMTYEKEKLSNISYQLINVENSFKKNNPQAYSRMRDEYKAQFIKVYGKDEYDKRHVMAKGGVLKNATYVSKRNINDIKVEINKSIKDLKGADLLDGVYVKNNALKTKFDAYESYNELSELNGKIWDKLKIESGSQIYASDSLQKKMAIEYQNIGLDAKFKKLTASQRKKVAEIMTDENEHSLRNYLTLRGYLGQKEYDSYVNSYQPKRPYVLNPANYKNYTADKVKVGSVLISNTGVKVKVIEYNPQFGVKVLRLDAYAADKPSQYIKLSKFNGLEEMASGGSIGFEGLSKKVAAGGKFELPHQLDKYFTKPAGTIEVEMSKLIPIRARKEGIENAEIYMKKAYDGEMSKRKPIEIYKTRNKKYRVNDGNSTYAVAKKNGWETIYAIVVSNPNVTKTGEKSTFTIAKEIRKEGESWSDAIKRVKENRK